MASCHTATMNANKSVARNNSTGKNKVNDNVSASSKANANIESSRMDRLERMMKSQAEFMKSMMGCRPRAYAMQDMPMQYDYDLATGQMEYGLLVLHHAIHRQCALIIAERFLPKAPKLRETCTNLLKLQKPQHVQGSVLHSTKRFCYICVKSYLGKH